MLFAESKNYKNLLEFYKLLPSNHILRQDNYLVGDFDVKKYRKI